MGGRGVGMRDGGWEIRWSYDLSRNNKSLHVFVKRVCENQNLILV